jgi:HEAT repeats
MALFDFLKPKWKRSSPAARIAGVAQLQDEATLVDIASNDPDKSVRTSAVRRLDEVRPKWLHSQPQMRLHGIADLTDVSTLLTLVQSDPDEDVCKAATSQLESVRAAHVKQLIARLRSSNMGTREAALKKLAKIGTPEAAAETLKVLDATLSTHWCGREFLIPDSLAKFAALAGDKPFYEALRSLSPDMQSYTAKALATCVTPEALPHLVELLSKKSEELFFARANAAKAIGNLGEEAASAVPLLIKCLAVNDVYDRDSIAEAAKESLKRIGISVAPKIFPLLQDPSRCSRAIEILSTLDLDDPESFDALAQVWHRLKQKNPFLLRSLVSIAPSQCREILAEALTCQDSVFTEDGSLWVDATAGSLLLSLKDAEPDLLEALTSSLDAAVQRVLSDIRTDASLEDVSTFGTGDRIFSLASFGDYARPILPELDKLMKEARSRLTSLWIVGTMACLAPDPRPHIQHLCAVMVAADAGHRDMAEAKNLRSVGRSDIADVMGYMAAWAAGSPAMTAQETLDRIALIMGERIVPVLREMRSEYPDRINACLESIKKYQEVK